MTRSVKIFWRFFLWGFASFILFLFLCNWGVFGSMPSIEDIQNPSAKLSSQVYAQDGSLMGKYYLEDRIVVEYKDINPNIINALVATEDERFQKHSGIDLRAIARAVRGLGRDGGQVLLLCKLQKIYLQKTGLQETFCCEVFKKLKKLL
jgi:penicillin-binding protein 1A